MNRRFLRQDTHWTPGWIEDVARDLADHLRTPLTSPSTGARRRGIGPSRSRGVSRVKATLWTCSNCPRASGYNEPQTVTVHRVMEPQNGQAWQASRGGGRVAPWR